MIKVSHISKYFGERKVLNDIDTLFLPGKCNLTIGKSGSGKTVLLRTIAGLYQPEEGFVSYDDRIFANMTREQKVELRKDIGFIFQDHHLIDSFTIKDNLKMPLLIQNQTLSDEKIDEVLDLVDLKEFKDRFPNEISGGQRQRVSIARALIKNPKR